VDARNGESSKSLFLLFVDNAEFNLEDKLKASLKNQLLEAVAGAGLGVDGRDGVEGLEKDTPLLWVTAL